MDMLYSRYACPMDLMNGYINRGQFGKFVSSFLESEYERRKEEMEKDDDMKLWIMYVHISIHSEMTESFGEWKDRVLKSSTKNSKKSTKDSELTDGGINAILTDLFPE
jgi:hypothetical protein